MKAAQERCRVSDKQVRRTPVAGCIWRSCSTAGMIASGRSGLTACGGASSWLPEAGDTYCLITCCPTTRRTLYATSHRFSVNQALGVLEVRDEEALQQIRPLLAGGPQEADASACSTGVSDADLAHLASTPRDPAGCPAAQQRRAPRGAPANAPGRRSTPRSTRWRAG